MRYHSICELEYCSSWYYCSPIHISQSTKRRWTVQGCEACCTRAEKVLCGQTFGYIVLNITQNKAYLGISMKLKHTMENHPEILANTSYKTTDYQEKRGYEMLWGQSLNAWNNKCILLRWKSHPRAFFKPIHTIITGRSSAYGEALSKTMARVAVRKIKHQTYM